MKKKKKRKNSKISVEDYVKAIKKADRDIQLEAANGWQALTRIHKSKKLYDRKRDKKIKLDD